MRKEAWLWSGMFLLGWCACATNASRAQEGRADVVPATGPRPAAALESTGEPAWTTGGLAPVGHQCLGGTACPSQAACPSGTACPAHCGCPCGGGGTCCGDGERLFGLFARSDGCFSEFVSPITNPLFFEDPRTLTEVRTIFAQHWIPESNPVFQGGQVQYVAVQARVALTERLSIIANKDGYIWLESGNDAAIPDADGWADVAAGLKYNVIRDPENQFLVSLGTTYELDVGTHRVFQGRGDGEFHVFASAGALLAPDIHWLTASGFRLPTDTSARSQMWYWSNHWDYHVGKGWYGLFECNWFHWMQSADALPVNFEGLDLFNLGAADVAGNDLVTVGFGAKKRFGRMNEFGVAWEVPVTERRDIIASRLYVDLILRY